MNKVGSISADVIKEAAFKCMKCGTCQSACPVYRETKNESFYARGKISLVEAVMTGKLLLTKDVEERLFTCLECRRCESACPSGVKVHEISRAIKEEIVGKGDLLWVKKYLFRYLFPYNGRFRLLGKVGNLLYRWFLKDLSPRNPIRSVFGLLGVGKDRVVPPISYDRKGMGIDKIPEVQNPRATFIYFAGCGATYLYYRIIRSTISVLSSMGIQVIFIEDIGCCGAPIEASGDLRTFERIRYKNVKMFNSIKSDGIVTTCGTCCLQLKESYYDKGFIDKPVFDISQVILKYGLPSELKPLDFRVTYHDPCHLSRGLGITKEPRDILKSIPGISFVEMFEADSCCGCAGFFTVTHYPIAGAIRKRKMDNIQNSGAEIVVSGCPGCMMHIAESITQRNLKKTTLHLVELVDMSLQGNGVLKMELAKQAHLADDIKAGTGNRQMR